VSGRTIALVGMRASGKTSVGRVLAEELGMPFVDLDDEIAREAGGEEGAERRFACAGDVLAQSGEELFREIESRVLERVLLRTEGVVLATGGGSVVREGNRRLLSERAYVIWLDVPVDELQRRLRADASHRPALLGDDPVAEVAVIARERATAYAKAADWKLVAGLAPVHEITQRIRVHLVTVGLARGM
jgi:shikimate kinase